MNEIKRYTLGTITTDKEYKTFRVKSEKGLTKLLKKIYSGEEGDIHLVYYVLKGDPNFSGFAYTEKEFEETGKKYEIITETKITN